MIPSLLFSSPNFITFLWATILDYNFLHNHEYEVVYFIKGNVPVTIIVTNMSLPFPLPINCVFLLKDGWKYIGSLHQLYDVDGPCLLQITTASATLLVQQPYQMQWCFKALLLFCRLFHFSPPLPQYSLYLGGNDIDVLFTTEY